MMAMEDVTAKLRLLNPMHELKDDFHERRYGEIWTDCPPEELVLPPQVVWDPERGALVCYNNILVSVRTMEEYYKAHVE